MRRGALRRRMFTWWRRTRFSAYNRRRDFTSDANQLNTSPTIPGMRQHDATTPHFASQLGPDGVFGRDRTTVAGLTSTMALRTCDQIQ